MLTVNHILKFKDGRSVSATLSARSPQGDYPVEYSGDVSRLLRKFEKSDPFVLEALFKNLARELNAELISTQNGEFDIFAE